MATAITSHTIGSDLKAYPDAIWSAQALGNTTTITSSQFLLGGVDGGVEVKVMCNTGFTLPQDESLTFAVTTATASGGSFTTHVTQTLTGGTGGTAYVSGDTLFSFVPPRELVDQMYTKIAVTTASDLSAGKVDAYLVTITK